ncbi:hypothetical protein COY93_01395 [Candidatus Uhrbacteria bacterium CG_4_10_14_0_8_um_filter_58_22]|uniref:Uncharacterized protein n=1 Tax=Candidatus Uhrbacteria bacterium CG_4_10_14_0_8_um_filter_58_22 TaxID=1975029 RepID=A0A2M7QBI9_9BACT|nr:MAG: hypothetical protein AUJ19_03765 [Parcubacteria group bacterium CG1_02_58_44]PIY63124.1 MAG: hypothetical protein COY93_01395 [Candidatus Uhrbacteria bacterium CG_4_10_14_0_8_um_filter_58_22]
MASFFLLYFFWLKRYFAIEKFRSISSQLFRWVHLVVNPTFIQFRLKKTDQLLSLIYRVIVELATKNEL